MIFRKELKQEYYETCREIYETNLVRKPEDTSKGVPEIHLDGISRKTLVGHFTRMACLAVQCMRLVKCHVRMK